MTKNLFTLAAISTLVACGGGGGSSGSDDTSAAPVQPAPVTTSSSSTTTPTNNVTPQPEPENTAPPEITRTADLTASDSFDFTSSYDVQIEVDLGTSEPRYLNVCGEFERQGEQTAVEYGSCVLQTPLENGQYSGNISLTNDVSELVIAIWDYSGGDPAYQYWNLNNDGLSITIN